ncbi:MAG TPA: hypothetical protein VGA78_07585 [Gemmatimonadales bacterium]
MNTIQMVLDHTPNEIADLEQDIAVMQERLRDSIARKQLLEQLLMVVQQRQQAERPVGLTLVQEAPALPMRATAGAGR